MDVQLIKCSESHISTITVFYRYNMELLLESTGIKHEMEIDMYVCKLYKVINNCRLKSGFTCRRNAALCFPERLRTCICSVFHIMFA